MQVIYQVLWLCRRDVVHAYLGSGLCGSQYYKKKKKQSEQKTDDDIVKQLWKRAKTSSSRSRMHYR